jgi:hypothetical protein
MFGERSTQQLQYMELGDYVGTSDKELGSTSIKNLWK